MYMCMDIFIEDFIAALVLYSQWERNTEKVLFLTDYVVDLAEDNRCFEMIVLCILYKKKTFILGFLMSKGKTKASSIRTL